MKTCRFSVVAVLVVMGVVVARAEELPTTLSLAAAPGAVAALLVPAAQEAAPTPKAPFAADTWTFQAYGSSTVWTSGEKGDVYAAHIGGGYFLYEGISVNLEAVGYYMRIGIEDAAAGGEAGAGGLDLLFRWHFLRGDGWSVYGDGGAGIVVSSESMPSDGTHFNFTPQAGVGATLRVYENIRLMGGARWFHMSNARIPGGTSRNPGFDSAILYLGMMIPF